MSNVKNDPKYKNSLLQAIRAQLEHRAHWLYLLCDEAQKRGLDPRDFGSDAVKRCGLSQGADLVKKGKITINVANAKKKASGYVVYCSYNKKFKKAKSFDVKNKNQCTFIVKKVLKKARPGWTYYYRIRPYVIDSTRKKVWGKYGKTYARLYRDK